MFAFRFVPSWLALIVFACGGALGQMYPAKPIRVVTISAGSAVDFTARVLAQGVSSSLGQPVVVDNRANFTAEVVSKALPDGYTLLVAANAVFYAPLLQKVDYDVARDFAPITMLVSNPNILVISPTVPANSVSELIALAKAKPGTLNYASGATGGAGHLTGELFKSLAGVNIVRVAYKTSALGISDLMSGQVHMTFDNPVVMGPLIKSGKIKGLAVTGLQPFSLFPSLPTVASSLPGFEYISAHSLLAPSKTPAAIIRQLNQESARALNGADAKEKFATAGEEVVANSPAELASWIKSTVANTGKVIKDANIKVE